MHKGWHWIGAQTHTLAHWHTGTMHWWCIIVPMQYESALRLAHCIGAGTDIGTMAGTGTTAHRLALEKLAVACQLTMQTGTGLVGYHRHDGTMADPGLMHI